MAPTVSVVTPFLNAEAYLAEAIESVRVQTLEDWELLLVDDGSRDGSAAIAAAAAARDPRIQLIRRPEGRLGGAAAARNLGLGRAWGEFVAFLDADDLFEPDKLRHQVETLRAQPTAAMLYGPTRWWHPGAEHRDWTEEMGRLGDRLHAPPSLLAGVLLLNRGHVPCTCAVLVRRSEVLAVKGFEERFALYEDQTLWVRLFLRYPVFVSRRCLARYRQHGASVSAEAERTGVYNRTRPHVARIAFLDWVRAHLAENGIVGSGLERALRIAAAPYDASLRAGAVLDRAQLWAEAIGRRISIRAHDRSGG
jgi:GT2 family glycosyltransferase